MNQVLHQFIDSSPHADERLAGVKEPFASTPPVPDVATRVVLGIAVLIGCLSIVGATLTSIPLLSGVRRWDASVNTWLAADRSDDFIRVAEWFSQMADTRQILGIMALVTIVLAAFRQWRAMLFVPLAMLIEISTFLAVNYLVARPRPHVTKIGPLPGTYSFPSGHVAATVVCWMGSALLLHTFGRSALARVVSAVGAVFVVFTAWARVYLGMHHTIDVVLGMAMGVAALAVTVVALNVHASVSPSRRRLAGLPLTPPSAPAPKYPSV